MTNLKPALAHRKAIRFNDIGVIPFVLAFHGQRPHRIDASRAMWLNAIKRCADALVSHPNA
jgi:hypothetical protein